VVIDWVYRDPWQGPGFASALVHLAYTPETAEYGGVIFADWRAANWHFISPNFVWAGLVQTEAAPEPAEDEGAYPPPAGRTSPAKRKRRRYLVEIDGREFEVESIEQARAILDRAKELARQVAEEKAERIVVERIDSKPPRGKPIHIPVPQITTEDVELQPVVQQARKALIKIYRDAMIEAELRLRLAREQLEEDDEDIVMLL
jgi:hypothetical protein